jgi:hypothetical protein
VNDRSCSSAFHNSVSASLDFRIKATVVTVRIHDHVARHQPANWLWIVLGCKKRSELLFGCRERLRRVRICAGHRVIMIDSPNCCKILVPYRQVCRRRTFGWSRVLPAGALAIDFIASPATSLVLRRIPAPRDLR